MANFLHWQTKPSPMCKGPYLYLIAWIEANIVYSENFDIWILTIFIIVIPWLPPHSIELDVLIYKSTSSHQTLKHSVPTKKFIVKGNIDRQDNILNRRQKNKIEAKQECRIQETRQYTYWNYVLNSIVKMNVKSVSIVFVIIKSSP